MLFNNFHGIGFGLFLTSVKADKRDDLPAIVAIHDRDLPNQIFIFTHKKRPPRGDPRS